MQLQYMLYHSTYMVQQPSQPVVIPSRPSSSSLAVGRSSALTAQHCCIKGRSFLVHSEASGRGSSPVTKRSRISVGLLNS